MCMANYRKLSRRLWTYCKGDAGNIDEPLWWQCLGDQKNVASEHLQVTQVRNYQGLGETTPDARAMILLKADNGLVPSDWRKHDLFSITHPVPGWTWDLSNHGVDYTWYMRCATLQTANINGGARNCLPPTTNVGEGMPTCAQSYQDVAYSDWGDM